jgi:hypothetical protein
VLYLYLGTQSITNRHIRLEYGGFPFQIREYLLPASLFFLQLLQVPPNFSEENFCWLSAIQALGIRILVNANALRNERLLEDARA